MTDVINKYCVYSAGCLNDTECRHCGHGKMLAKLYEQGYQDGGSDMEKAKQIIIDGLLKQIGQIRADMIKECIEIVKSSYRMDAIEKLEQLKEKTE